MNAFDKARLKYEKNRERQGRGTPQGSTETLKEKEEPKVEEVVKKAVVQKIGPMVVRVSGPADLVFEVQYSGALIASQTTPQALRELLTKQLSALGRVTCQ